MAINYVIKDQLVEREGIWFGPEGNYWSNLDKSEQEILVQDLRAMGAKEALMKHFPQHVDVVFSSKRAAGLALLDLKPGETVLDAGCMWGALTIPAARAGCKVIGIEQTFRSLSLLQQRVIDEKLSNVNLVCADLKKIEFQSESLNKVIVNGVLEWIPQTNTIELKQYFGKKAHDKTGEEEESPGQAQRSFLSKLFGALKNEGVLYLAIENRFDFLHFLGKPDPHCDLKFVTFLPRFMQNLISRMKLGRPYINWIYSPSEIKELLTSIGFSSVEIYYAFPDYRFPEFILSSDQMGLYKPFRFHKSSSTLKKAVYYLVEEVLYRRMKLSFFAPSLIILAKKG